MDPTRTRGSIVYSLTLIMTSLSSSVSLVQRFQRSIEKQELSLDPFSVDPLICSIYFIIIRLFFFCKFNKAHVYIKIDVLFSNIADRR